MMALIASDCDGARQTWTAVSINGPDHLGVRFTGPDRPAGAGPRARDGAGDGRHRAGQHHQVSPWPHSCSRPYWESPWGIPTAAASSDSTCSSDAASLPAEQPTSPPAATPEPAIRPLLLAAARVTTAPCTRLCISRLCTHLKAFLMHWNALLLELARQEQGVLRARRSGS